MTISVLFRGRSLLGQVGAFALGLVLVLLTLALRLYLTPTVQAPGLVFFVPAILLASSVGGLSAGLFATLVSCLCSAYFLLPPLYDLRVDTPFALSNLASLAVTGMLVAVICELLRKAIRQSEATNAELVRSRGAAERLAAIVEGSRDAIIGLNLDGIITTWNTSAAVIFGYRAHEAVGAHISLLVPPSLLADEDAMLAEIASGQTISPFETRRLHKDGSIVEVSLTVSPIRDAGGTVIGASKTMRDITARKRTEEDLRFSQAMLEAALRSMSDAIFICNAEGGLVHTNQAFATFHRFRNAAECPTTLDQFVALFDVMSVDGEMLPLEQWPASRALRGEAGVAEVRLRRKDTGQTWIGSVNFAPIISDDGLMRGAVLSERDVTEQKATEARLLAMRNDLIEVGRLNELGHVSAGIAHELNQPLAAMLNYSNAARRLLARGDPESFEKAHAAIAKATEQAARAGEIVLRTRALVEKWQTIRRPEDPNAIIEDAVALETTGALVKNISIRLVLAPDPPPVFVDRAQIQHVILNLLRNAFDAVADASWREITVSSSVADTRDVEVTVADTGHGIPQDIADRLFMPFFTTKPGGMGIGLVISQSIIEAHGGRISVQPREGGGTVFQFRLPAMPGSTAP